MPSVRVDRAHAGLLGDPPRAHRWSAGLGWAFAALLLAVYAVLAWRELNSGLEFDESFNLTVVLNLADGLGYSSNGAVLGTGTTPFDPFVSTGPALLLPSAAVWALTGSLEATRIVPLGFFALYLAASGVLGNRVAGVPGALAAIAAPLLLSVGVRDLVTWSLVPGRFVGEIPASALLMTAAVLLPSKRTSLVLLGGLCCGLAIQTKLNFLTAVGVLGVYWLIAEYWATRRMAVARWSSAALGVALPTIAFEVFRYLSLHDGYRASLRETKVFLDAQSQSPHWDVTVQRARDLFDLFSWPGLALLVVCGGLVVARAALRGGTLRRNTTAPDTPERLDPRERRTVGGLLVAALTLAVLWVTISSQPSLRQGLPALLVALPPIAALLARNLVAPTGPLTLRGPWTRWTAGLSGIALVLVVLQAGVQIARGGDSDALLVQQRAAATAITRSGSPSLPVEGWWTLPEFQVLTDLPVSNHPGADPPTVRVFSAVRAWLERGRPDARVYAEDQCQEVLYASWGALVCR